MNGWNDGQVNEGDLVAEIETDKATMGFESQEHGYLAKIFIPAGTRDIKLGTLLCVMVSKAEDVGAFKDVSAADLGGAVSFAKPAAPAAPAPQAAPPPPPAAPAPAPAPVPPPAAAPAMPVGRVFASPFARMLAEQKGIDLTVCPLNMITSYLHVQIPCFICRILSIEWMEAKLQLFSKILVVFSEYWNVIGLLTRKIFFLKAANYFNYGVRTLRSHFAVGGRGRMRAFVENDLRTLEIGRRSK